MRTYKKPVIKIYMKNLFVMVVLIFSIKFYSQNISLIKNLDTIYVDFKESATQIKTGLPTDNPGFKRWYIIQFKEKNKD